MLNTILSKWIGSPNNPGRYHTYHTATHGSLLRASPLTGQKLTATTSLLDHGHKAVIGFAGIIILLLKQQGRRSKMT
jgi:hypothetical protein